MRVSRAQDALKAARVRHAGERDYAREQAALIRAQALGSAGQWNEIAQAYRSAVETGDHATLTALRDVAVPLARQRTHGEFAALKEHGGAIEHLAGVLDADVLAASPEYLRKAATELEEAESDRTEIDAGLASVDFRLNTIGMAELGRTGETPEAVAEVIDDKRMVISGGTLR